MNTKKPFEELIRPNSAIFKDGYNNVSHSVICVEPLSKGFGDTIGNALRRVLLSSVGGYAVTSIKIEGATNEFSVLPKIREDVAEIIMNIKALSISRNDNSSPFSMKLSTSKEGPIYAGSLICPEGVKIMNGDMLICNVEQGGKIDMQLHVEYGLGYGVAADHENSGKSIDFKIQIDPVFTPVKKVLCRVENARVGQITNYDRLIIEIITNGAISPKEALSTASSIIQDQFSIFIDKATEDKVITKSKNIEPDFNKNLIRTIDELELSVRSYNCLKNENITYVGDLVSKTESEMLKTANFGRKSLNELKDNLRSMGLAFGMKIENWPPKNLDEMLKMKNREF